VGECAKTILIIAPILYSPLHDKSNFEAVKSNILVQALHLRRAGPISCFTRLWFGFLYRSINADRTRGLARPNDEGRKNRRGRVRLSGQHRRP
jgi:hypothetical protein